MRIFAAIPLPQFVKDHLYTLSQAKNIEGKWEHPDNYHITLRFIGDVDDETRARYTAALKTVQAPVFHMTLQGLGRFPPVETQPPRVLWVGVTPSSDVIRLYEAVSSVLEASGLPKDKYETYSSHMTLARFKHSRSSEELNQFLKENASFRTEPMLIDAFVLYQSTLTPQRAVYTEIERFPLT